MAPNAPDPLIARRQSRISWLTGWVHEIGTGESDQFLADLARVVLARPAVGNAHDVEVRAQVALRPVIPPHNRADAAEAGPQDKSGCGRRAVVSI